MTSPELSKTALAQMLRTLADRVDSGADVFEVSMEAENIGHATKTTITLWGLEKPKPPPAPQWCTRLVAQQRGPDKLCNMMLWPDGTCPQEEQHRKAVRR